MLCSDLETSTEGQRLELAERVVSRQVQMVGDALSRVASRLPGPPQAVILAGEGEFLAARVLRVHTDFRDGRVVALSAKLGQARSWAACAHALAILAVERSGDET
jgi:uncharacterized hydantoinase/oxoprolinase family protein